MPNPLNPRYLASQCLVDVIHHHKSLDDGFHSLFTKVPQLSPQDKTLIKALCYGVCRWYHQLIFFREALLSSPLKPSAAQADALLLLGLLELTHMATPDHAAINETVKAAKFLKQPWAAKLVNGVLRNFQRNKSPLMEKMLASQEVTHSHPLWLVNAIKQAYPSQAEIIFTANNQQAPMILRVNQQKVTSKKYLETLLENHLEAQVHPQLDSALVLNDPCNVDRLPGFEEGFVSVQDGAPQLAATLLDLKPNERVLDACAAPGNKTCHILERAPNLQQLTAIDISATRLKKLSDNLQRLDFAQAPIDVICGDVAHPETWWDGKQFHRILLDAPCSATGVIRRHPDIKLLRTPQDIQAVVKTQAQLLEALWPLLAPQGMLLYATCSILPEENEGQMAQFLGEHPDAQGMPLAIPLGSPRRVGHQILPGEGHCDGFYYCGIRKM